MHDAGYKSALARRVCRYSDARPPRKTDGVLLESELPPHMRGKGVAGGIPLVVAGITPTYAGKRSGRSGPIAYSQDHPRVCGEKLWASEPRVYGPGSPPHMRGKVGRLNGREGVRGITPAYAGKRFSCKSGEKQVGDHPRICGEKLIALISTPSVVGSPPRMRGKASGVPPCSCSPGITPAYAGKRARGIQPQQGKQDHPRVCGEKSLAEFSYRADQGSPPRMRGKAETGMVTVVRTRITPAYAGKR